MSIVLKTDPKTASLLARRDQNAQRADMCHDALAMHATLEAIGELEYIVRKALLERAAANMARLMGEGNG